MANLFLSMYLLIIRYEPETISGAGDIEKYICYPVCILLPCWSFFTAFEVIVLRRKSDYNHVPVHNLQWFPIA